MGQVGVGGGGGQETGVAGEKSCLGSARFAEPRFVHEAIDIDWWTSNPGVTVARRPR